MAVCAGAVRARCAARSGAFAASAMSSIHGQALYFMVAIMGRRRRDTRVGRDARASAGEELRPRGTISAERWDRFTSRLEPGDSTASPALFTVPRSPFTRPGTHVDEGIAWVPTRARRSIKSEVRVDSLLAYDQQRTRPEERPLDRSHRRDRAHRRAVRGRNAVGQAPTGRGAQRDDVGGA